MLKKIKDWDGDKLEGMDIRMMTVYNLSNAHIRYIRVVPENSTSYFFCSKICLFSQNFFKCTLYGRILNILPFKIPFQEPVVLSLLWQKESGHSKLRENVAIQY